MSQPEPRDLLSLASDAAMRAAEELLEANGADLALMMVTLVATGLPPGEHNANTAGLGFGTDDELFAFLLGVVGEVGERIGRDVRVIMTEGGDE
jgi:hypothetical protein